MFSHLNFKRIFTRKRGWTGILPYVRRAYTALFIELARRSTFVPTTIFTGSLSNYDDDHNDDFKKNNRFNDQNNSSARASRFLVHFFDVHCTSKT